jgi:hypothetical protein
VRAVYRADASRIHVYYTEADIPAEEDWGTVRCGRRVVRSFVHNEVPVRFHDVSGAGYSFFFVIRRGETDAEGETVDFCGFLQDFLERFAYFRSAMGRRDPVPFPAILGEMGR